MIVGVGGASGNVGALVIRLLLARDDDTQVIALSRRSIQYPEALQRRPAHKFVDYNDEISLCEAFGGLDTLVFPGSDGDPDEMLLHHRNVVTAVSKSHIRHVVYLSTQSPTSQSPFPYARVHYATEGLFQSSGAVVTVLRASIFSEFFIQSFVQPAMVQGLLSLPTPSGSVAFVSREDAAAALAGAVFLEHEGSISDVTGPESISMGDVVTLASTVSKKQLRFEVITEQVYRANLAQGHYGLWLIEAFATMMSFAIPNQSFRNVSSDVLRLTGSQPRNFRDVLHSTLNK